MNIWMQEYTDVCSCIFVVDFSLLNTGEFLNREMNLCEIKNHLLCKWSSRRLIALEKPPML